jgi:hypothetical protein
VKELDPEGHKRRAKDLQRRRKEYIVPGPDYIWSLDGHDKLQDWGIEIYAAIDAYSRKIMWIYVGISNRTAVSVADSYNKAVSRLNYHPQILRTDHGMETLLMNELHFALCRASNPTVRLEDCYFYGTSKKNQRIESWWAQLEKSCLWRWRVC